MKTVKTPKQLSKLKPIKVIVMSPNGRMHIANYDFGKLPQNHKFFVVYNKRTRIAETMIDMTMMFGEKANEEFMKMLECHEANIWSEGIPEEE